MAVDIIINGVPVGNGTKYSYTVKYSNDKTKTFDGMDISPDEVPEYTVSVERIELYSNADQQIRDAVEKSVGGIPITLVDKVGPATTTAYCIGCFVSQKKVDRDPKKKRTQNFDFDATTITEVTDPGT